MGKQPRKRKSSGWAHTKNYPHKRHPAYYRKQGIDDIEYVTFTHSESVTFDGEKEPVSTKKLKHNINSSKQDDKSTYVVPRVYKGKRSTLGKETIDFKLHKDDFSLIDEIFKTSSRFLVPFTSNSDKKKTSKNNIKPNGKKTKK